MRFGKILALLLFACFSIGASPLNGDYAEGQVWEYRTRPGDEGSLLKVQKIEILQASAKAETVYHISIIGLHFDGLPIDGQLQHAPFSKASLDASVTRLSPSTAIFPEATAGIAEWREAQGGVFTVTVAEAVAFMEQALQQKIPVQQDEGLNFSGTNDGLVGGLYSPPSNPT